MQAEHPWTFDMLEGHIELRFDALEMNLNDLGEA